MLKQEVATTCNYRHLPPIHHWPDQDQHSTMQQSMQLAGPDPCTLCPDLCTMCLWCFPSFNWCKHSTCTGGGCHQLQLVLVVLFHLPLAQIVHLHTWCYHSLQLALVVLFHPATDANSVLAITQLALCSSCFWWWWCFFIQPLVQIVYWQSRNLHCAVVAFGGSGVWMWMFGVV